MPPKDDQVLQHLVELVQGQPSSMQAMRDAARQSRRRAGRLGKKPMQGNDRKSHDPAGSDSIAQRLRSLRNRPIDTTHLETRLQAVLGLHGRAPNNVTRRWLTRSPLAAILLVASSVVGILFWWGARPVAASPMELARAHADNIRGEPGAVAVTSMDEAHRVMAGQWSSCPHLAETSSAAVVSCHLHDIGGKRLLCVRLDAGGLPITLAVGRAADLRLPDVTPETHGSTRYFVQTSGETNILTFDRDDLWISVIGEASSDRLIEIAGAITGAVPS